MRTSEFDYDLPRDLIAQIPAPRREDSRLLVVDRKSGSISHRMFRDFLGILSAEDLVVLNETRVVPAKLSLRRHPTGGAVEATLLRSAGANLWEALVTPSSRLRVGSELAHDVAPFRPVLTVEGRMEDGHWLLRAGNGLVNGDCLEARGEMPLPPYIRRSGEHGLAEMDRERYQTVYARTDGAVAAPTAGLHFSEEMLARMVKSGPSVARIVLHVGVGTFIPVKSENVEEHAMAAEEYVVEGAAMRAIRDARLSGRRIVAVGTTCVRVLETVARLDAGAALAAQGKNVQAQSGVSGWTDLFITPGFRFLATGSMLTNFHMPCSTPYVLVCSLAGIDLIRLCYAEAIRERYRFLSYGDAMLIL